MPDSRRRKWPAPVSRQIESFAAELEPLLREGPIGIYVHGSLALGCFNFPASDVDLLVVVRQRMADDAKRMLAETVLAQSGRPCRFDLHVLVASDLQPWTHPCPFDFHCLLDGRIRSKDEAGVWGMEQLLPQHRPLVQQALAAYRGSVDDVLWDQAAVERLLDDVEASVARV